MWAILLWTLVAVLILSNQMYMIIARFLRVLLYTYFRKVNVCGINNLPREGPVLLCPNHPNMLVDGILVASECVKNGRQPYVWVKAEMFRNKFLGWILRSLGGVPVFRPRHDVNLTPEQLDAANKEMFQKTWEKLSEGNVMLLFPEGTSYTAPKMLKLRTGVVRVATGFVKNYDQPIPVIPVGLTYFRKDSFRSQVLIDFGTPLVITPEDVTTREFQQDEKHEIKRLTDELERKMHAVTLNASEFSTIRVARTMRRLYLNSAASIDANKDVQLTQQIINMLEKDGESIEKTQQVQDIRTKVERYKNALDTLRVKDQDIVLPVPQNTLTKLFLERILYLLVLVPLGTPGLILNLPFYLLGNKLNSLAGFTESKSMFKILAASVVVPIQWLFFIFLAWLVGGTSYAYVVSVSLPLLLYSHIRVMEESRSLIENVRFLFNITAHRDQVEAIRKERSVLAEQVNALVTAYVDPTLLKTVRKAVVDSENSPVRAKMHPTFRFRGMSSTDSLLQ